MDPRGVLGARGVRTPLKNIAIKFYTLCKFGYFSFNLAEVCRSLLNICCQKLCRALGVQDFRSFVAATALCAALRHVLNPRAAAPAKKFELDPCLYESNPTG